MLVLICAHTLLSSPDWPCCIIVAQYVLPDRNVQPVERPTYLVIGHITIDRLPDGTTAPGGTALYGGLTAQRLGFPSAIVTAAATIPGFLATEGPEATEGRTPVQLHSFSTDDKKFEQSLVIRTSVASGPSVAQLVAPHTTTLVHTYHNGQREQVIEAVAPQLTIEAVPPDWRDARIVHLGPILGECDLALVEAFPRALVGANGQGWLRGWQGDLPAPMERRAWHPEPALLARLALLTLSSEDIGGDERIAAAYAAHCPLVALTYGAAGLTLFINGVPQRIPAYAANERDANGAGDVFTAAMLCHLAESGDPIDAARFGAAAAACAVEGFAHESLPTYDEVVLRMA
jgi:sugar/nucleoside kinase (ribokinase family)